ncbi:hypothetical protein EU537_11185 [Candidatus Thorarchaeota archaeon]|nr:MAG: hypothetical protein EU537_11185 [Candidatus Thorarchaeota archaeon]
MNSSGDNRLGLYLSKDPKPQCGKAAPIQKGVVPSRKQGSADLCEEGIGIGVPLLKYRRDFYFPGTATTSEEGKITSQRAWKKFDLNLIDRHQKKASSRPETFSWVYQRLYNRTYKTALGRRLIELSGRIAGSTGVNVEGRPPAFYRVKSKGTITVDYEFENEKQDILVSMNLEGIDREGLQEIFLSNEMGGILFDAYRDDTGVRLRRDEISGWDKIEGREATFYSPAANLFFKVSIPDGVRAFRGREIIDDIISWSGVILSLPPSTKSIKYLVKIGPVSEMNGAEK